MTFEDCIEICPKFSKEGGTPACMRADVLPRLRKELEILESCRHQCEARSDWIAGWKAEGLVDEENRIRAAIDSAEKRLAEIA